MNVEWSACGAPKVKEGGCPFKAERGPSQFILHHSPRTTPTWAAHHLLTFSPLTTSHSTTFNPPPKASMATPVPLDRAPPTTMAYVIAAAIIAGVTGYFIGQGASLGLFHEKKSWPNSYDVKVHRDSSDEEAESEDESENEGNGDELKEFDNSEDVKMVLVVRTDLGMTKGMLNLTNWQALLRRCSRGVKRPNMLISLLLFRQDCRPSFPRFPRMLQIHHHKPAQVHDPFALGKHRTSEDRAAGQIRGGNSSAAGPGHQPWSLRACHPGCRSHTDS